MSTWEPSFTRADFAQADDTTTEVYSRDWQGGKGPTLPGIGVNAHDYVDLTYDGEGNVIEVKYFIGGPDGLLVTHLILNYQSGNLKSVRKLNLNIPTNPALYQ